MFLLNITSETVYISNMSQVLQGNASFLRGSAGPRTEWQLNETVIEAKDDTIHRQTPP